MSVHTATLSELVVTKLALYLLDLEMNRVDVSVQHVHAAVRFCADVAVDGECRGYLARTEGAVWSVGVGVERAGDLTWSGVGVRG